MSPAERDLVDVDRLADTRLLMVPADSDPGDCDDGRAVDDVAVAEILRHYEQSVRAARRLLGLD